MLLLESDSVLWDAKNDIAVAVVDGLTAKQHTLDCANWSKFIRECPGLLETYSRRGEPNCVFWYLPLCYRSVFGLYVDHVDYYSSSFIPNYVFQCMRVAHLSTGAGLGCAARRRCCA